MKQRTESDILFGRTVLLFFICLMTRIRGSVVHYSLDLLMEVKIYSSSEH